LTTRSVKVFRGLKGANAEWAEKTRTFLVEKNVVMLNMIGSPGCGKTSILESVASRSEGRISFAVLEGDLETTRDAERMAAVGIRANQLLTGGGCHLEARLVHQGLKDLAPDDLDFVFVENVGNLVCPVQFDIGEAAKVGFLSVTEGEDKPLKYPLLFKEAKAVILTKIDLLPHVQFDEEACLGFIGRINPKLPVFRISSKTGEGMDEWMEWLLKMKR
jgi:hydrogenase nickel incorporation protein HypB